jgi:hypothetical protein
MSAFSDPLLLKCNIEAAIAQSLCDSSFQHDTFFGVFFCHQKKLQKTCRVGKREDVSLTSLLLQWLSSSTSVRTPPPPLSPPPLPSPSPEIESLRLQLPDSPLVPPRTSPAVALRLLSCHAREGAAPGGPLPTAAALERRRGSRPAEPEAAVPTLSWVGHRLRVPRRRTARPAIIQEASCILQVREGYNCLF